MVRVKANKITLAIGDGNNDCNMIQEADIGCGIFGQEGMRAAMTADYALGEFQCLRDLLLVHGRQNYIRLSYMILYFIYKNMLFTMPQFFNNFLNGASGQTVFDDFCISFYNLFFTGGPLIMAATFDWDLNPKHMRVTILTRKKATSTRLSRSRS